MLITYHLSSTSSVLRQSKPRRNCGRGGHLKGRNLCGGFRPFSFGRKGKAQAVLVVGRTQGDPSDRTNRDDQLFCVPFHQVDRQRQKSVARLARERAKHQPFAVLQLDLHMGAIGRMRRGVALDLLMDPLDEVFERRLGGARDPQLWRQNSFEWSAVAPICSRPSSVTIRPRGVRCRNPSWRRYGS